MRILALTLLIILSLEISAQQTIRFDGKDMYMVDKSIKDSIAIFTDCTIIIDTIEYPIFKSVLTEKTFIVRAKNKKFYREYVNKESLCQEK